MAFERATTRSIASSQLVSRSLPASRTSGRVSRSGEAFACQPNRSLGPSRPWLTRDLLSPRTPTIRPSLTAMSISSPFECSIEAERYQSTSAGLTPSARCWSCRTGHCSSRPYGVRSPHGSAIRSAVSARSRPLSIKRACTRPDKRQSPGASASAPVSSARVLLRRLEARQPSRFLPGGACPVGDDPAAAHADHPGAHGVALGAAGAATNPAASPHEDAVAEVHVLVAVRLEHVPEIPGLGQVLAHSVVAPVAAGLDAGPGKRQELHVGVVEAGQRVEVPGADGLKASLDELDVLRHNCPILVSRRPRTPR